MKTPRLSSSRSLLRSVVRTGTTALLAALPVVAQHKLSAPLPRVPGGSVSGVQVSPDGVWAVYRQGGVYSTAIKSDGVPALLSSSPGSFVGEFEITSDSSRVVFVEANDLFVADMDGVAPPLRLAAGVRGAFALTPDGTRAVYSTLAPAGQSGLYSISVAKHEEPVALALALPSDVENDFRVSPDSAHLVYRVRPPSGSTRIYTARVDGSAPPRDLTPHARHVDPTGQRVGFFFELEDESYGLYTTRVDGTEPPVRLNSSGIEDASDAQFSPDGRMVVFSARQTGVGQYEVWSVPADGSAPPIRLSPPLPPFADANLISRSEGISPDGSRILLGADLTVDGSFELLSVPITGGPAVTLSGPLVAGGSVRRVHFSPDGTRLVYLADQTQDEVFELYSVPSAGGAAPVKLNQALVTGGDVDVRYPSDFHVTADGARVVYCADSGFDERFELWSTPITHSQPVRLNAKLAEGGDVLPAFRLSPDGQHVLYQTNGEKPTVLELFVAPTDGGQSARRVNGPLLPGGTVGTDYPRKRFAFSPRSDRVLYMASEELPQTMELFQTFLTPPRSDPGTAARR